MQRHLSFHFFSAYTDRKRLSMEWRKNQGRLDALIPFTMNAQSAFLSISATYVTFAASLGKNARADVRSIRTDQAVQMPGLTK